MLYVCLSCLATLQGEGLHLGTLQIGKESTGRKLFYALPSVAGKGVWALPGNLYAPPYVRDSKGLQNIQNPKMGASSFVCPALCAQ